MKDAEGERHRVAVYGTLKREMSNHDFLRGAQFIGETVLTCVTLYDLGLFPAAKLEPSDGIAVEVYEIDDETLGLLDRLEGYRPRQPEISFYHRHMIETPLREAWIYVYCGSVEGYASMREGSWG
jgi:gamma-glutamylcyclotransferase (GGCT)/AIG2-like uncharacterized protein YtfP